VVAQIGNLLVGASAEHGGVVFASIDGVLGEDTRATRLQRRVDDFGQHRTRYARHNTLGVHKAVGLIVYAPMRIDQCARLGAQH
jgi:hypothetical protein